MNILKVTGKFLDQPLLVAKFKKQVPLILTTSGAAYCTYKTINTPKEERKNTFIKNSITLSSTIISAIIAPKVVNKIFKINQPKILDIKKNNKEMIDSFIATQHLSPDTEKILNKAKESILNYKEIKYLMKTFSKNNTGKTFLNQFIPEPENISSKEIFSEIGRLSLLGLIPVIGGIAGGISGDLLTAKEWKDNIPNKIKEGAYQYLANIFLCNVGAGIALGILEKANIKSKTARASGMIMGIITTGIIGGSALANLISNYLINPIFGKKTKKGLYNERHPEPLDIGLHVDDIATVAVMSGLKWIEPALPIMYSISGFRAGIGYRNSNVNNCNKK